MATASPLSLHPLNPRKTAFPSRAVAASSPPAPASTAEALEEAFGRKGIKFSETRGGGTAVELSVRNGSSLSLSAPRALITSYKPKVYWKDGADGCREALYSFVAGDEMHRGGIGVVLAGRSTAAAAGSGTPWSASEWAVRDADADSLDAVQVELACTNLQSFLDVSYVVTLYDVSIASAVIVRNTGERPVELTAAAVLSHIKFDTRFGTAVEGLRGCMYRPHPPPPCGFSILSPTEAVAPDTDSGWFGSGDSNGRLKGDQWVGEEDMYTILRQKTSRVYSAPPEVRSKRFYSTPPSKYTTIDQSSGLGFRVIRMGFEDIYLGSPGGTVSKLGAAEGYYICTGPASMLVPVVLQPGEEWRGAQVIEHDNL